MRPAQISIREKPIEHLAMMGIVEKLGASRGASRSANVKQSWRYLQLTCPPCHFAASATTINQARTPPAKIDTK